MAEKISQSTPNPAVNPESSPSAPSVESAQSTSSPESVADSPERSVPSREQAQQTGDKVLASIDEEESSPIDDIRSWSQKYTEDERDFARYASRVTINTPEERARYERRLLSSEHDVKFHWDMLEDETTMAIHDGLRLDLYQRAEAQRIGTSVVEPAKSVEAAVGIFYEQRMQDLSSRIKANSTSDAQADLKLAGQTWRRVQDYLDASKDIELLHMDVEGYHRVRTACHNNMIRQLNSLNQLAQKYGTTPFTPRNFMDNDFAYNGRRDKGNWLNSRAEYDRETVMQYFTKAFQKDFDRAAESIRRQSARIF